MGLFLPNTTAFMSFENEFSLQPLQGPLSKERWPEKINVAKAKGLQRKMESDTPS